MFILRFHEKWFATCEVCGAEFGHGLVNATSPNVAAYEYLDHFMNRLHTHLVSHGVASCSHRRIEFIRNVASPSAEVQCGDCSEVIPITCQSARCKLPMIHTGPCDLEMGR